MMKRKSPNQRNHHQQVPLVTTRITFLLATLLLASLPAADAFLVPNASQQRALVLFSGRSEHREQNRNRNRPWIVGRILRGPWNNNNNNISEDNGNVVDENAILVYDDIDGIGAMTAANTNAAPNTNTKTTTPNPLRRRFAAALLVAPMCLFLGGRMTATSMKTTAMVANAGAAFLYGWVWCKILRVQSSTTPDTTKPIHHETPTIPSKTTTTTTSVEFCSNSNEQRHDDLYDYDPSSFRSDDEETTREPNFFPPPNGKMSF